MSIDWIQLSGGLHIILEGSPRTIPHDHPSYKALVKMLPTAVEADILAELDKDIIALEKAIEFTPEITMKNGTLYFNEMALNPVLSERMLQMHKEGFELSPMIKFINNLMENPSSRVVNHLYSFLETGRLAITNEGHFVAYKAINSNWMDCRTNSIDNSVGQVVSMPRNQVDENPLQTCSYGLHVCSWDYLAFFAPSNGHIVECRINPRDVVAIPADYNDTKMRVCSYTVTRDLTAAWNKSHNVLADVSVRVNQDAPFQLLGEFPDGHTIFVDEFSRLSEAAAALEMYDENSNPNNYQRLVIFNAATSTEIDCLTFDVEDEDDDDDDDESQYHLVATLADGSTNQLSAYYCSVNEALMDALFEMEENSTYAKISIINEDGVEVRQIS